MIAGRPTIIEAKPEPLTVNCAETALIVVDMQNDFCSKGGLFDRAGINISAVRKAVGPTRKVLSAARESGIKPVYLKMGFRADLSDLGDTGSVNRVRLLQFGVGQPYMGSDGRRGRFLIRDTWNKITSRHMTKSRGGQISTVSTYHAYKTEGLRSYRTHSLHVSQVEITGRKCR